MKMFYHQILFNFKEPGGTGGVKINTEESLILKKYIDAFKGDIEYKCWSLHDANQFLREYYPLFLCFMHLETQFDIVKCDIFRYILMYHFGGLYTDIDFLCVKPIKDFISFTQEYLSSGSNVDKDSLKNTNPLIVLTEEWHDSVSMTKTIHNGFLISLVEKHPFWLKLIFDIYDDLITKRRVLSTENDVYLTSGPKKLCSFYSENKQMFSEILVLPYFYCCPYFAVIDSGEKIFCNSGSSDVPSPAISSWVFFKIHNALLINQYCPESFFVNVALKSGSMWK
jgi:hypothetical protein